MSKELNIMDFIRTILLYLMMLLEAAGNASPALTPPPASPQTTAAFATVAPAVPPTAAPTAVVPTPRPTAIPTAVPTATPTAYTTLYVGDRGEEVRKLQRRLTELGYLNDRIDGVYGQNTKRAVERFQYYNNLTVDGIAGRATQKKLYESLNVVTAPPEITQNPTPRPTLPQGVNVPVYYVDQNGRLLKRVDMMCYGNTTIYANSYNVPAGYSLISANAVSVIIRNGAASPASVTFSYRQNQDTTPAPTTVSLPVYYMTDTGTMLTQTYVDLARGKTSYVQVNTGLVPVNYQLTSASTVAVTVSAQGVATPASVVFTFRNATPIPSAEPKQAVVPVRYVSEAGYLLNETYVTISYGQTMPVYASAGIVQPEYRLVSQNPVSVTVNQNGTPTPAVVIFTYAFQAPTAEPTQIPTEEPTVEPTEEPIPEPTQEPTPEPTEEPIPEPTQEPTPEPTEEPIPEPTQEPTPEPTEEPIPEPTQEPTPEPTEEPIPEPTQEPTPEPTQEPTPEPTEEPTPEPTQEPTPEPDPLTKAGGSIQLNSDSAPIAWYKTLDGNAMISLKKLAEFLNWDYSANGSFTILGHAVNVSYSDNEVFALTVDGQSHAAHALAWQNDLYVGIKFFQALGIEASASGGQFALTIPQE